jgi:hypothetical protein
MNAAAPRGLRRMVGLLALAAALGVVPLAPACRVPEPRIAPSGPR